MNLLSLGLSATTSTLVASCAYTRTSGVRSDDQQGHADLVAYDSSGSNTFAIANDDPARNYYEGTRYITSLGLPSDIRINPPDWIVYPAIDGVMGAVGVASTNDLGTREQPEELGEALNPIECIPVQAADVN